MTLCKPVTIGLAILAILASPFGARSKVAQKLESFPTFSGALEEIEARYKANVGFESVVNASDHQVSVDFSPVEVAGALRSLVAHEPVYTWKLDNGVYDVFPKAVRDSVLDVVVRDFSVKDVTLEEASDSISSLPEFRSWLSAHHARRHEIYLYSGHIKGASSRVSLVVSNVPLRTVLNDLIIVSGERQWTVLRYGDKEEYIAIYL
jgi:hypothetical protein